MPLNKADGVKVSTHGLWFWREARVWTTGRRYVTLSSSQYQRALTLQQSDPALVCIDGKRKLWWYRGNFYWDSDNLDAKGVSLLVWDRERRLDARLTRLAKMKDSDIQIAQNRRDRIPEDVRIHVFQRDGGKCQRCGSSEELQFDHIVPVSKGGANAVENVELLCGNCNRLKSDNIT